MNHKLSLLILIIIGALAAVNFVLAWEVGWPEIPGTEFVIGDKCPATGCPPDSLPLFIAYLFTFALIAAGMVALLMLVLGAVQYTASAAMPSTRVAARGRMTNAILGLLLLFGTYVLLNTINPELVMPGLGLGGTIGTEDLTIPESGAVLDEGVELCSDDQCTNCLTYNYPVENLNEGEDRNMEDQAKAFKILDSGVIVNFWEHRNFKGEVASVEGPTPCLTFEDVSPPDLTEKVSSINFLMTGEGINLCETEGPTEEKDSCEFFPYQTGQHPQQITYKYDNNGPDMTILTPAFYDLSTNAWTVKDDKARWVGVPAGFYGVLCRDPDYTKCYYLLDSTNLLLYGEAPFCVNCYLHPDWAAGQTAVSAFIIEESRDNFCQGRTDCKPCKGVVFYTKSSYNREIGWLMKAETAAWPNGLGDVSTGGPPVDLTTNVYNYTQITTNFPSEEVDEPNGISSFRLIGNCKMKVCDQANLVSPNCNIFYKNEKDLGNVCRPFSAICTEDFGAICPGPLPCDTGACACCDVPVGKQTCSCCSVPTTWDDAIKSFVLCNADDDTSAECAGWVDD